jgi:hypothetical protein
MIHLSVEWATSQPRSVEVRVTEKVHMLEACLSFVHGLKMTAARSEISLSRECNVKV